MEKTSPKIQVGDKVRYTRLPHCPDMIVTSINEINRREGTSRFIAYCGWFDKNSTWCEAPFSFDALEVQ